MPSCRVPETLGSRFAVSTASRWTCGSISGPETRRPAQSIDLAGLGRDPRLDRHDARALDGDVGRAHGLVLVRDERVLQDDVHTRFSPPADGSARVNFARPAFSPNAPPTASRCAAAASCAILARSHTLR